MIGIILLFILATWLFVAITLSVFLVSKMQAGAKKSIVGSILIVLISILPVADEIIGGFQFRALCNSEELMIYDPEKIQGKSVVSRTMTPKPINRTILPVSLHVMHLEDLYTGEVLITRKKYYTQGGLLSRLTGGLGSFSPFTFNGNCSPEESYSSFFESFNIERY